MTTLVALMTQVRALRDELHDRLDDNVTNRVFKQLRLRHVAAVIQARREVEDPSLPSQSPKYTAPQADLTAATSAVASAISTDEPAMLAAISLAQAALALVAAL